MAKSTGCSSREPNLTPSAPHSSLLLCEAPGVFPSHHREIGVTAPYICMCSEAAVER